MRHVIPRRHPQGLPRSDVRLGARQPLARSALFLPCTNAAPGSSLAFISSSDVSASRKTHWWKMSPRAARANRIGNGSRLAASCEAAPVTRCSGPSTPPSSVTWGTNDVSDATRCWRRSMCAWYFGASAGGGSNQRLYVGIAVAALWDRQWVLCQTKRTLAARRQRQQLLAESGADAVSCAPLTRSHACLLAIFAMRPCADGHHRLHVPVLPTCRRGIDPPRSDRP